MSRLAMRYCIAEGAVADDCESHGVRLEFVGQRSQVRQADADDEQERFSREERRARGRGAIEIVRGVGGGHRENPGVAAGGGEEGLECEEEGERE